MDRSLFITGGSGFLGYNWINNNKNYHQYFLINYNKIPNQDEKNFFYKNDINNLSDFLIKKDINTILHFAAITDLEICESNLKKCMNSNFDLTKELVLIAKRLNLKFFLFHQIKYIMEISHIVLKVIKFLKIIIMLDLKFFLKILLRII